MRQSVLLAGLWVAGACAPPSGSFTVLTYNVAGLPEGLSSSNPERNHPLIAPKLNAYDLVLVQEDFAYHELLLDHVTQPSRTEPKEPVERFMGDGLAFFSRFSLTPVTPVSWSDCAGVTDGASDCLAEKGFAFTTMTLEEGIEVVVYDLHADAAGNDADVEARRRNFAQLAAHVKAHAAGKALIVAGDTNLKDSRAEDMETLTTFLGQTGLADACRTVTCPVESIDRVLFRSSDALALRPVSWAFAPEMVDDEGGPLSDHEAVRVAFDWTSLR